MAQSDDVVIDYPNRDKASSKTTKAVVVLLLLVTAGLMAIVTIGGWEQLQGATVLQVAYIFLFLICAFYIARPSHAHHRPGPGPPHRRGDDRLPPELAGRGRAPRRPAPRRPPRGRRRRRRSRVT